ncbi:hypothetical protein MNB_SV-14-1035 [hydrothermal vent metagenome]|uniref:Uncharacterized protein n=1 Tax=hydrothermal vent metagenome TaxID=652676 RepID=A0A1W1CD21_9ZZZZ
MEFELFVDFNTKTKKESFILNIGVGENGLTGIKFDEFIGSNGYYSLINSFGEMNFGTTAKRWNKALLDARIAKLITVSAKERKAVEAFYKEFHFDVYTTFESLHIDWKFGKNLNWRIDKKYVQYVSRSVYVGKNKPTNFNDAFYLCSGYRRVEVLC